MLFSAPTVRRAVASALGAGAFGAVLFGVLPTASAQPAPPPPPNCTAADFSGVASGVSAASSAYLFTHPDVNNFFTSLHGLPPEEIHPMVVEYMEAHPQERDELTAIRQPLIDIRDRCGYAFTAAGNADLPE
ncbi:MAG: heme-binding protein [Actinomycetota bacterium]|nr:heme-binding protein [Actinomycetota bacterium]